jgi:two-component sensor histidine kinase
MLPVTASERLFTARMRGALGYALEFAVVAAVYVAVAKLSLTLASIHPSATPIWPTTGYALAATLLRGYRVAPAIFLGAVIANATTDGSFATSVGIATGNMLESLVGAYCIRRWSGGLSTFDTPANVAKFAALGCVPATMISATLGVGSLSLAGYAAWGDFLPIWTTWWVGDLAGALVIAPILVLWGTAPLASLERKDLVHSALVYGAAIAVGLIVFSPLFGASPGRTALAFISVLPLMWAALWRNPRDTATVAILLSGFAVWGTVSGAGPFVQARLNDSFLLLLAFMLSVSIPSLALAAEVAVRKRHEEHVEFVVRELSHRSKNLLSVVQNTARQLARQSQDFDTFLMGFHARLKAFADTNDLLVRGNWLGAGLAELVKAQTAPFHDADTKAVLADGPPLQLGPQAAEYIGLLLHELGTNAAKHGALSVASGQVTIAWRTETDDAGRARLRLTWRESGGPPVVPPAKSGFGRLIVTKIVPSALRGTAVLEFESDGVRYTLLAPESSIRPEDPGASTVTWVSDTIRISRDRAEPAPVPQD